MFVHIGVGPIEEILQRLAQLHFRHPDGSVHVQFSGARPSRNLVISADPFPEPADLGFRVVHAAIRQDDELIPAPASDQIGSNGKRIGALWQIASAIHRQPDVHAHRLPF